MDELCLSVKALGFSERIDTVLSSAIEPPDSESVATTVNGLKGLGAFNEDESMTALGHTLAKLPLEPRIGKMLVLGAVFGVLFGIGGLVAIVVTYYCCFRKKTVSWVTLGSILIPTISY